MAHITAQRFANDGLPVLDRPKSSLADSTTEHLAEIFDLNLENTADKLALQRLMQVLHDEQDELLWWLVVRAAETHATREARHFEKISRDGLTGALNGAGFYAWLHNQLENQGEIQLTFIMIDLVNFKKINDTFNLMVGDEVIKEAIAQLRTITCPDEEAVVIRFSGDELALAAKDLSEERSRELLAHIHAMQLVKLKHHRHRSLWQRIKKVRRAAGTLPRIEVRATHDTTFGPHLAHTKREVCIADQPVAELDDLIIMASGLAYGSVTSKTTCRALIVRADHEIRGLKTIYHCLMGGAYRNGAAQ